MEEDSSESLSNTLESSLEYPLQEAEAELLEGWVAQANFIVRLKCYIEL